MESVTQWSLLFLGRGRNDTPTECVKGKKPLLQRDIHIYNFVSNFKGFTEALKYLGKVQVKNPPI